MTPYQVVDTFPAFLAFWRRAQHQPLEAQIEGWAEDYMAQWPELLAKQQEDYASQNEDWQRIARERVFPFLGRRLSAMQAAHRLLLDICSDVYIRAQTALSFDSEVVFVIYVGIGCGAGWVTTYQSSPAVLFGLENIAEEGWTQPAALTGLVAHEMGHVVHFYWRAEQGFSEGSGPWWQLYTEGFAQRCEHVILGEDTWHMALDAEDDWLDWCQAHKGWLAAEFLRAADEGESVRPFFGSWFEIRGRKQCGYFLGHEVTKRLEESASLGEIALLSDFGTSLRRELVRLADTDA